MTIANITLMALYMLIPLLIFLSAPSAPPTNVNGASLSSESIHITWNPPPTDLQNGLIRSYIIEVTENETGIISQHSTSMTQITLSSLHAFYHYDFTVAARTVSNGPKSPPERVQTHPDGM